MKNPKEVHTELIQTTDFLMISDTSIKICPENWVFTASPGTGIQPSFESFCQSFSEILTFGSSSLRRPGSRELALKQESTLHRNCRSIKPQMPSNYEKEGTQMAVFHDRQKGFGYGCVTSIILQVLLPLPPTSRFKANILFNKRVYLIIFIRRTQR